jgi:hypothetical protein
VCDVVRVSDVYVGMPATDRDMSFCPKPDLGCPTKVFQVFMMHIVEMI